MRIRIFCTVVPLAISGVTGYLAGYWALHFGAPVSVVGALSGIVGALGAQCFNYTCILLVSRYAEFLNRIRSKGICGVTIKQQ